MVLASYIRPFDAKQKIYVLDGKKNTEEIVIADLDNYGVKKYKVNLVKKRNRIEHRTPKI